MHELGSAGGGHKIERSSDVVDAYIPPKEIYDRDQFDWQTERLF